MKLSIATNIKIKPAHLAETKDFTGFDIVVIPTKETIKPNFHTNNMQMYGDFDHVRSLFTEPTDARCFVTSRADLIKKGITQNYAAYDNADKDTVYDFYMGLATRLDRRAKANGFKCNLAWEVVHEMCHGAEWFNGNGLRDRVHGMEAQGKLKDLWRELFVTLPKQKEQLSFLQAMLAKLLASIKPTVEKPVPFFDKPYRVTQAFGIPNSIYSLTKHHLGTDFACPKNTPVYAPLTGTLTKSYGKETGNVATFATTQGTYQFLHCEGVLPEGKYHQGEVIAYTGNTGTLTTGNHCCVRLWVGKPDISVLTKDNFTNYLKDVTK